MRVLYKASIWDLQGPCCIICGLLEVNFPIIFWPIDYAEYISHLNDNTGMYKVRGRVHGH